VAARGDLRAGEMSEPSYPTDPSSADANTAPVGVLPYITPLAATASTSQGIWRDGARLITTRKAELPPLCVKCAAPADGSYKRRTFYWHHPAWALLVLFALLLYAIVAMIVRKKSVVVVGLCRAHQARRTWLLLGTWLLSLGGIAAMIAGPVAGTEMRADWMIPAGLLGGIGMIFVALLTGFAARVLVPTKIDDHYAWFKGCGGAFLSQFPPAR
jgi:hypothetical protein